MTASLPAATRRLSDRAWLALVKQSLRDPRIGGVDFPGFPTKALQAEFVGSADEKALDEAFAFYDLMKRSMRKQGRTLRPESNLLDFGCGWGRFLRLFWKDVNDGRLYGCDVSTRIVELCRQLGVPGRIDLIKPRGALPYPDAFFDGLLAYSVFTHLPSHEHMRWMKELARVARPGAVFCLTLEPRRFLDFIGSVPTDAESDWHRRLAGFKGELQTLYDLYDHGQVAFIATNEGVADTYGDAAVPLEFVHREWGPWFEVVDYIDKPDRFWQAVLVVRRR